MDETVAMVNKLIEEHKAIVKDAGSLEQVANDAALLEELREARDAFVPGRFDQKKSLQKLQELLEMIDRGLKEHFNREETGLLAAFEKHGDRKLVSTLKSLLLEHEDLRNRLSHAKEHVAELVSGGLARHLWEASANDMRAHLSHTRKLLEAHANVENELFVELRRHLKREMRGRS
jgi:iron-sulfur cluster repair protein YtfE (RIC family)